MDKMIIDTTPNMYDLPKATVRVEDMENLALISLEDLGADQTIGDDNVDEPVPTDDADFIFDDETNQEEDSIEEGEELTVFEGDGEDDDDDEFDDTGFTDDDFEDMSDDSNVDE